MPCGATQYGQVMVERSDRMWSTGKGNGEPLQYSCFENLMNSMKRQNDRILKEELPRSVGAQYATGDQWRNNLRKNEGMDPKQKQYPVVDVIGDRSKVQCCKEQYCIGTWNVRSMNQGKLEVVKQEMVRVNSDILGISKLKWIGMGEFNSVVSDCLRPCGLYPPRLLCPWDSPGKNTGVGYHLLLQGIFPTQGSNPGLLYFRQTLYPLSHQGSPWI